MRCKIIDKRLQITDNYGKNQKSAKHYTTKPLHNYTITLKQQPFDFAQGDADNR